MYLNAQVYTGTARYTDAITYCNKIIAAGYTLHPNYRELMLADNNLNTDEFIFVIAYDGTYTQNWGRYHLPHSWTLPLFPEVSPGTSGNWGGLRVLRTLWDLLADPTAIQIRPQFYTTGQNLVMNDLCTGTDGYSITKYRNKTRSGGPAPMLIPQGNWVDIDFPKLFRLGEIYLIYAEAVCVAVAAGMQPPLLPILMIAHPCYGNTTGNITAGQLTTDFILDERGRELYFEAFRRTDQIRYNQIYYRHLFMGMERRSKCGKISR